MKFPAVGLFMQEALSDWLDLPNWLLEHALQLVATKLQSWQSSIFSPGRRFETASLCLFLRRLLARGFRRFAPRQNAKVQGNRRQLRGGFLRRADILSIPKRRAVLF